MVEPIGGLAAKAVTPLVTSAINQALKAVWKYYRATDLQLPDRRTIAEFALWLERKFSATLPSEDQQADVVMRYLRSAELVTLLEHMLAFRMSGRTISSDGPLFRELISGIAVHGGLPDNDSRALFNVLLGSTDKVLGKPIAPGEVLDADSRTESRNKAIEAFLKSIDVQVSTLSRQPPFESHDIEMTLGNYRRAALRILGKIQPPSFDGAQKVSIDRLYVLPRFRQLPNGGGSQFRFRAREVVSSLQPVAEEEIPFSHVRALHRCVVLGDPGGGKTTLGKKIAHDMIVAPSEKAPRNTEAITPFIVVLRDFGEFLKLRSGSIADFIADTLRSTYQLTMSVEGVEWLLATGRLLIIFDGLDELLDLRYRSDIADAIDAFATLYTNTAILVTSRRIGYLQAPLSDAFTPVRLAGFDMPEVREYVSKWFGLDDQIGRTRRLQLTEAFLKDSKLVEDLRENPLILALMCTIYRSEGYIPRNRPDVYEKCAMMLFDKWDRHRGLRDSLEFEAHLEPALMHLAYAIYTSNAMQSGITERVLINEAANYLQRWQYEDRAMAEHAARQFISFCRGRAWVFTDVGLTADHEPLYQFTHQTFLEYFAAAHLARSIVTIGELCEVIMRRIERGEWEVVAQLALQIKARTLHGGADAVVDALLEREQLRRDSISLRSNVLGFVARSLTFLVISPACVRRVAEAMVAGCLAIRRERRIANAGIDMGLVWAPLRRATREVQINLFDAIADEVVRCLTDTVHTRSLIAVEACLGLAWSLQFELARDATSVAFARMREACAQALVTHSQRWAFVSAQIQAGRAPSIDLAKPFWQSN